MVDKRLVGKLTGKIKEFLVNKKEKRTREKVDRDFKIDAPVLKIEKVDPDEVDRLRKKHGVDIHTKKTPPEILNDRKEDLKIFRRAGRESKLYKDFSNKTGFNYQEIDTWEDLKNAPLFSWENLFPYYKDKSKLESILVDKPRYWITTTGRTRHKHYPWSERGREMLARSGVNLAIKAGIKPRDRIFKGPAPAPFATKFLMDTITNNLPLELYDETVETLSVQLDLVRERGFDVGASAPNSWLRLAEGFSKKAPEESKKARLASVFKKIRPKDKEEFRPRLLVGGGTAISSSVEEAIKKNFGTYYVDVLASTESGFDASGCYEDVLHKEVLYNGASLVGILPRKYIDKKGGLKSNYEVKFPHEVEEGTVGEKIIYNFNTALTLIGMRTEDIIKVTQNDERCECGSLSPKILFVGRLRDDPIDINGAKVWKRQFREIMGNVEGIKYWQVKTGVEQNKVTLDVIVEPYENKKVERMKNGIKDRFNSDPEMEEFREQKNAFFSEMSEIEPLEVIVVEDQLSKEVEKNIKEDKVYKIPNFRFTSDYLERGA